MPNNKQYPVVLFVYKRHYEAGKLLRLIRSSGASHVYVFADGPKSPQDRALTDQVKKVVGEFKKQFRDIKVSDAYAPQNLGLKNNIVKGLTKVFTQESAAIVLEDDCMPVPDFFKFTSSMLAKYESDKRVMSVTGTSVGSVSNYSYDFAKYQLCWGWATWKRAWDMYDAQLEKMDTPTWQKRAQATWGKGVMRWYWQNMLRLTKVGQIDTWDFQWSFAHFFYQGLAIIPIVNLIKNVGFDSLATNTKTKSSVAGMPTGELVWPLKHPVEVRENQELSALIETKYYQNIIAFLGMLRQLFYWKVNKYADRS